MKCERCGIGTTAYGLHDYCWVCSRNLCGLCFDKGKCQSAKRHVPANHGEGPSAPEPAEPISEQLPFDKGTTT